jgi:hypothetical protein
MRMRGGFSWDDLPKPWDAICYTIMWYMTLEDFFQLIYYYHFPILNHFRNLEQIFFSFFVIAFAGRFNLKDKEKT